MRLDFKRGDDAARTAASRASAPTTCWLQAESGLISVSDAPDAPGRIGVSVCDIGAGMASQADYLTVDGSLVRAPAGPVRWADREAASPSERRYPRLGEHDAAVRQEFDGKSVSPSH